MFMSGILRCGAWAFFDRRVLGGLQKAKMDTAVPPYPDKQNEESDCRQHIDRMLNTMDENELTIMEATAEGIQKARETEGA